MIFEQFNSLKRDRTVKATIGMSREKFDALVPVFADAYALIEQEKVQNKEIKHIRKGGPKGVLDTPEKRLFFILYYLKTYPTFDVLGFHFDLSAGHAHDYVVAYSDVLRRALETLDLAPERTADSLEGFRERIESYGEIIIDGMESPCVRPVDEDAQRQRYSGKKNAIPSKP
jgi:hypothetical protein